MKLNYNYDGNIACRRILEDHLEKLNVEYQILDLGQIEITDDVSAEVLEELQIALNLYSIHIINNPKGQLIQQIKDAIVEIIYQKDKPNPAFPKFLAESAFF